MKSIIAFFILLLILFQSCTKQQDKPLDENNNSGNQKGTAGNNSALDLKFEGKDLVKSYKDCNPGDENCTYIRVNYEVMTSGPNAEEINSVINDSFLKVVYVMEEEIPQSMDTAINDFMSDFVKFTSEYKDAPQVWTSETNGKHVYNNRRILSYEISNSAFTGGAHPNSFINYINFDLQSGHPIKITDVMNADFEDKLNSIIDEKLRAKYKLTPQDSLQTAGFFESKVTYNDNFTFQKDGIMFYYNNYEIAPYVMGATEINIYYTELGELLNKKWIE